MFGWFRRKLQGAGHATRAPGDLHSWPQGAAFVPIDDPVRSGALTADQVVPRIKHVNFLAAVKEHGAAGGSTPVTQPLVADLLVTYALDLPGAFKMLNEEERGQLGLSHADLHLRAVQNLRRGLPPVRPEGQPPVIRLSVGEDLDACLLLLDEIWERAAADVPDKLVAAVPHRGVMLYTSSSSPEGLATVREIAAEVRQMEPTHALSEALLAWERGKWVIFEDVPAEA